MAPLSPCFPKTINRNPNFPPKLTDSTQNFRLRAQIQFSSRHESRLLRRFTRGRRTVMCSDRIDTYNGLNGWTLASSLQIQALGRRMFPFYLAMSPSVLELSKRCPSDNANRPGAVYKRRRKPGDIHIRSVVERLKRARENLRGQQQFLAMYSSVFGGITTDPAAMVLPMDDHMVHRGHGVFDTATIIDGFLYELDQHLDRILRSASMAKIALPFDREIIRRILIQTVSVSECRDGSLRYWLSAGPGDFFLSPSQCPKTALYAIVIKNDSTINPTGVKVVTSSVPIKSPEFATTKSVNYLPNVLSQMEAEAKGAYVGIWLDNNGFVAEGPNMNVAFVTKDKELLMPHFDNILSGCTAKRALRLAEGLVREGKLRDVKVCDVTVEDGKSAGEMMLLGSGILVRPVIQWDEQIIGDGKEGPIAKALLDLLFEDMKSGPPSVRVPVPY